MSTRPLPSCLGLGLATAEENDTACCCYALQDKVWVHGPGNEPWEVYTVKADAPEATSVRPDGGAGACDCGAPAGAAGQELTACC